MGDTNNAGIMPRRWRKGLLAVQGHLRAALRGELGIAAQLIRGVSGGTLLKVFYTLATFVTAVLLARTLGAEDYGIYAYAISWITLIGVFAKAGIDQVMVRNISIYHHQNDWGHIRGMLRFAIGLVCVAGLFCALGAAAIAWLLHNDEPAMRNALWVACLLLPLQALIIPFSATQMGLRQVVLGQLPGLLIIPLVFLAAMGGVYLMASSTLTADQAIALRIGAVAMGLGSGIFLLHQGLKRAGCPVLLARPAYQAGPWLKSAMPLVLMGSMFMVNANADILMLGSLVGAHEAGVYKVATRGAELLTFSIAVISTPLGPIIARLHAAGEHQKLQEVIRRVAWLAFLPSACLGAFFLLYGELFLQIFGTEFAGQDASTLLATLTIGQLILSTAGPVGLLLVMCGREQYAARAITGGAIINIVLNSILIPVMGSKGAALATASSTIALALVLVYFSITLLKINPSIIVKSI